MATKRNNEDKGRKEKIEWLEFWDVMKGLSSHMTGKELDAYITYNLITRPLERLHDRLDSIDYTNQQLEDIRREISALSQS